LVDAIHISSDGRYLLVEGACPGDKSYWDLCAYSLEDGSTVGWSDRTVIVEGSLIDRMMSRAHITEVMTREFHDILAATKLLTPPSDDTAYATCNERGKDLLFCYNGAFVKLLEPASLTLPRKTTFDGFPEGRVLWMVRAADAGARIINSCALSADNRWLAFGADGKDVLLFDTEQIESKSGWVNSLLGSTQQPALVKRFEMP